MKIKFARCNTYPFGKDGCEIRWTFWPGEFNLYVWLMRMQFHWRITW